MNCQRCKSIRLLNVCAKTSDCVYFRLGQAEHHDYIPHELNLGDGDYVHFAICLDCGQIQGEYPRPPITVLGEHA
jgi:hypothetical protein